MIPHETQLPRYFLVAENGMYRRNILPDVEEIVLNLESGEATFLEETEYVKKTWEEVSRPLLLKQTEEAGGLKDLIIRKEQLKGGEIALLVMNKDGKRWIISENKNDVDNFPYYPFTKIEGDLI